MSDNRGIGVFDSGLGGLTVMREITSLLPGEDIIYFGDCGRVPYGTKSRETVIRYARQDENFLLSKNVKMIVAACGTVSSVARDTGAELPVPFVEVVTHSAKAAVERTRNKVIGVLATSGTVKSGAHEKEILRLLPDARVVSASGTLLVSLVEEGWFSPEDPVVCETVRRYVEPIANAGADTLILGCTHFPVLAPVIRKVLPGVVLVNMGTAAAMAVKAKLSADGALAERQKGTHRFFVSDKAASFSRQASVLLGETVDPEQVITVQPECL